MKQKELLFIAASFFLLFLIFIGFSIYHNFVTSNITDDVNIQILPISPSFDEKTISDLKKRKNLTPVFQITPTESQSPLPTITPIATSSATTSATKL